MIDEYDYARVFTEFGGEVLSRGYIPKLGRCGQFTSLCRKCFWLSCSEPGKVRPLLGLSLLLWVKVIGKVEKSQGVTAKSQGIDGESNRDSYDLSRVSYEKC